eukprot:3687168-Rhodomonas_salina.2
MSCTSPLTVAINTQPVFFCSMSGFSASLRAFSSSMNGVRYATAFFITRADLITCSPTHSQRRAQRKWRRAEGGRQGEEPRSRGGEEGQRGGQESKGRRERGREGERVRATRKGKGVERRERGRKVEGQGVVDKDNTGVVDKDNEGGRADLGKEHLSGSEEVADGVHALHERALDDVERRCNTRKRLTSAPRFSTTLAAFALCS